MSTEQIDRAKALPMNLAVNVAGHARRLERRTGGDLYEADLELPFGVRVVVEISPYREGILPFDVRVSTETNNRVYSRRAAFSDGNAACGWAGFTVRTYLASQVSGIALLDGCDLRSACALARLVACGPDIPGMIHEHADRLVLDGSKETVRDLASKVYCEKPAVKASEDDYKRLLMAIPADSLIWKPVGEFLTH